jgi:voltage-gated potassium channel
MTLTARDTSLTALVRLVWRRMGRPLSSLVVLFVVGSLGYALLMSMLGRSVRFLDCAFMTVISVSGVGYGEYVPLDHPAARVYTMVLLVVGLGVSVWSMSAMTAFIVEGEWGGFLAERALQRELHELEGHTIICGLTPTSTPVVEEHLAAGRTIVVIERDVGKIDDFKKTHDTVRTPIAAVVGDPSDEDTLLRAGLLRASALVDCLGNDKDNLFLLVTARQLRSDIPIYVECSDEHSVKKLLAAGATHVVNPTMIGGMRLASQVLRPHAVAFLDQMLRAHGHVRVNEIVVEPKSALDGVTLNDARVHERTGLVVVALRLAGANEFVYSPAPTSVLLAGTAVIVIGEQDRVARVMALASSAAR